MFRYLFRRYQEGAGDDGDKGGAAAAAAEAAAAAAKEAADKDAGGILASQRDKEAADAAAAAKAAGGKGWSYTDGVAGEGDAPEWFKGDKYKTVADQAKALTELEPKLGAAADLIGAPEEDYVLPDFPEGVDGEWDKDDPMIKTFAKVAKELDLSQGAHDTIVQAMVGLMAKENTEAVESVADALSKIGTNVEARITAVDNYIGTTYGKAGQDAIDDAIGSNVEAFKVIEGLVIQASGDAQLAALGGASGVGFTKEEIEAERYKVFPEGHPSAGQKMYDVDKAHREKVDDMWKKLFPGTHREEVG